MFVGAVGEGDDRLDDAVGRPQVALELEGLALRPGEEVEEE